MKTILLMLMMMMVTNAAEIGVASHYSTKTGTRTASGERLVDSKFTAAHKTLKFGTLVKVTNLKNNKTTVVKITDRGPYKKGRIIDVSQAAAKTLGFHKQGIAKVKVEVVKPQKQCLNKDFTNTMTSQTILKSLRTAASSVYLNTQKQVIKLKSATDFLFN